MMRIITIQPEPLSALRADDSPSQCMHRLIQAGLLQPEGSVDPDSPLGALSQLFRGATSLMELEDQMQRDLYSSQLLYLAPRYSIPGLIGLLGFSFFFASLADDYGERLWRFGGFWMLMGTLAVGISLGLWGTGKRRDKERRARLARTKKLATSTQLAMLEDRDRVLEQSFAAVVKGRLLVHLPHDRWLERCLRELSADHGALRERFSAARNAIALQVKTLAEHPPESWTDVGLRADVSTLAAALEAAGIDRVPPQPTG
jgi:hypothetical protein